MNATMNAKNTTDDTSPAALDLDNLRRQAALVEELRELEQEAEEAKGVWLGKKEEAKAAKTAFESIVERLMERIRANDLPLFPVPAPMGEPLDGSTVVIPDPDAWKSVPVSEVVDGHMKAGWVEKLVAARVLTFGDLKKWRSSCGTDPKVVGLGAAALAAADDAVVAWWKAHPVETAEQPADGTPPLDGTPVGRAMDAAKSLRSMLSPYPWLQSIGSGEQNGKPALYVYTKSDVPAAEMEPLKEGWEGYPVLWRYMGEVLPAGESRKPAPFAEDAPILDPASLGFDGIGLVNAIDWEKVTDKPAKKIPTAGYHEVNGKTYVNVGEIKVAGRDVACLCPVVKAEAWPGESYQGSEAAGIAADALHFGRTAMFAGVRVIVGGAAHVISDGDPLFVAVAGKVGAA